MRSRLNQWFEGRSAPYLIVVALALITIVLSVDLITGTELTLSLFYLAPTALAGWYAGRRAGLAIGLAAGAAWYVAGAIEFDGYSNLLVSGWNAVIRIAFLLVIAHLLTTLRSMLMRESRLARIDPLTGAGNARSFAEVCRAELSRSKRHNRPVTIAYLDLDDFKKVNDELGHAAGDRVLRTVVDTLRATLRTSDVVARFGGDEFGLLLPETDEEAASIAVARVQEFLGAALDDPGSPTFSMGVATFTTVPETVDAMIHAADDLMYEAKREGKNKIRHRLVDPSKRSVNLDEDWQPVAPKLNS
jgi:diguanylate cyclase (GGDEF)-like protein